MIAIWIIIAFLVGVVIGAKLVLSFQQWAESVHEAGLDQ